MTPAPPQEENALSPWAVLAMASLAGGGCLIALTGGWLEMTAVLVTTVTEGGAAALVFLAAGGIGVTITRRFMPETAPPGLAMATGCA